MSNEWYSEKNLKKAWRYVKKDIRDDFVFDVIDYDDIRNNIDHLISFLHNQIEAKQYYPIPTVKINVPKNLHSVRPGTTVSPIDLIVLYAITQQLAPLLDPLLSDSTYAYRLNPKAEESNEHLFKNREELTKTCIETNRENLLNNEDVENDIDFPYNWFRNWKAFHNLSKEASKNYAYVAVTDITAFFENISLDLLRNILLEKLKTTERELIDRLFCLLEYWLWSPDGNLSRNIGLLQGNDVSSFLSNLYLLDLDDAMLKIVGGNNNKYYRYVDDIKLFTNDEDEARQVLLKLEETLRKLHLNVQSSKTKIVSANNILDLDVEMWLEKMSDENPINDKINSAIEFYDTVLDFNKLEEKWERPYLRVLTVLKNAKDDRAIDKALQLFLTNPSHKLLKKNYEYLLFFVSTHKYGTDIINKLEDKKFIFPYHKAYMYRLAAYSRDEIDLLKKKALDEVLDKKLNWFCRMAALFCLSTFYLNKSELSEIVKLIENEGNTQVMRAVYITLLQYSGSEFQWIFDKLKFFNAPYQNYFRLYFFKFSEDIDFSLKQISLIKKSEITSHNFIHNLYKLDLLKLCSKPLQRSKFKEVIDEKKHECNNFDWPRLSNRLDQIYNSFVIKA